MQALATASELQTDSVEPRSDGLVGVVLGGRYRVLSKLGAGGMGEVYVAEHRLLGCRVAIKTLNVGLQGHRAAEERFRREAALGAAFSHPNLVRVLDFETAGVAPYLVMELLEGQDVRALLNAEHALPFDRAVRLIRSVLAGLGVAHAQGIVHRDLKPANLFVVGVGSEESCKVLDFGVASIKGKPSVSQDPLTMSGRPLGTLAYMAPEQIRGAGSVDARADVYSAAAILFELVSGRRVFEAADAPEQIFRTLQDPVPRLDVIACQCPRALAEVVERALSRRPEDRFADAATFAEALAPFAGTDMPMHPAPVRTRRTFGQKILPPLVAGCALGIVASIVVSSNHRASAKPSPGNQAPLVSSCATPLGEKLPTPAVDRVESVQLSSRAPLAVTTGSLPRSPQPSHAPKAIASTMPAPVVPAASSTPSTITVDRGNPYQ